MAGRTVLPRSRILILQTGAGLATIAVITAICSRLMLVNATTAGFAYLLAVLGIATGWGFIQAAIASVAAMLCWNFFFLPPIGQFTIADPQNWVALFAFVATAAVASHLSNLGRKQARDARAHQRETEQLYALSRTILLTNPTQSIGFQAAQHIAEIFACRSVALYDAKSGDFFRGGAEDLPDIECKLKRVALDCGNIQDKPMQLIVAPIVLGGNPIGSLALKGLCLSDGALQALLNLVAIALERVRTEEAASRAEAARQSEEFKSTLLDAIAHEFKTPLTSVKAASTSMLADRATLSPKLCELASIIDEETDRLSLLVTEAVRMSQIDAGKVMLERKALDVADALRRVLAHFDVRADGRPIHLCVPDGLPYAWADQELVSLALRQLIDNALKYSSPNSPIDVTADAEDDRVILRVRDQGPGIPERDRERVFQKFYRRNGSKNQIPGTGLGLYIAREIIRTHGGDIWIESQPGGGSEFCVSLPVADETGILTEPRSEESVV